MRCCDEAYAESHATSEAYAELVVGTLGVSYRGLVAGLPLTNCGWHHILHVRGSIPHAHASLTEFFVIDNSGHKLVLIRTVLY